jgi:hypothetical protein
MHNLGLCICEVEKTISSQKKKTKIKKVMDVFYYYL